MQDTTEGTMPLFDFEYYNIMRLSIVSYYHFRRQMHLQVLQLHLPGLVHVPAVIRVHDNPIQKMGCKKITRRCLVLTFSTFLAFAISTGSG